MKWGSRFVAVLAALIIAVSATMAKADEFGAIAFSKQTGAHGFSHNYNTRAAAENRVMTACRNHGGGCRVVIWFRNACGALAVGRGNGSGCAYASTRQGAESRAFAACQNATSSCQIRRWVCSR